MRRLIYVPIVHTMVDMGSEAESLRGEYIKRYGEEGWVRSRRAIEGIWDEIRKRILSLKLRYRRVRIYQDGLPVCGRELEIMAEVAAQGSRNYQIVQELVRRGATLEGTEDPALLLEEYRCIKAITTAKDSEERKRLQEEYAREGVRLLRERDAFISRRIDETLKDGEVGILFLGSLHRVDEYLPADFHMEYLTERLPIEGVSG